MHLIYVGHSYDGWVVSEDEFLDRCPTISAFSEALAVTGASVTVMQRFARTSVEHKKGVTYRFVRDTCPPHPRFRMPRDLHRAIAEIARKCPDTVVHVNGCIFPLQVRALRRRLPRRVPIVVQHHAERPWRGMKQAFQRFGLTAADGFMFASKQLATAWSQAGLISATQAIYEVMESPVTFSKLAERSPSVDGCARFLWVGNLDSNKDPLTVLAAFEDVAVRRPEVRLEMIYSGADLERAVRERIAASDTLRRSVAMIGKVVHDELPPWYANSDFFVLGSHREGSGYALAEAMAHGAVPIVTDIPSFATMTGNAAHRWRAGDAADCKRAMLSALAAPIAEQRERVRRQYREFLSAEAIAASATRAYADALTRRRNLA